MGEYHAFPSVEKLASAGEDFYASIGAGYRAAYLDRVAKTLLDEDVNEWKKLSTSDLRSKLLSLYGVGRKVADCALLFGFSRFDVFPVDTWIKKRSRANTRAFRPKKCPICSLKNTAKTQASCNNGRFITKEQKSIDKTHFLY